MSENQLAAGLNKLLTAGLLFLPEDAVRSLFAGAPPSSKAGARASDRRGARTILRPLLAVLILHSRYTTAENQALPSITQNATTNKERSRTYEL